MSLETNLRTHVDRISLRGRDSWEVKTWVREGNAFVFSGSFYSDKATKDEAVADVAHRMGLGAV